MLSINFLFGLCSLWFMYEIIPWAVWNPCLLHILTSIMCCSEGHLIIYCNICIACKKSRFFSIAVLLSMFHGDDCRVPNGGGVNLQTHQKVILCSEHLTIYILKDDRSMKDLHVHVLSHIPSTGFNTLGVENKKCFFIPKRILTFFWDCGNVTIG